MRSSVVVNSSGHPNVHATMAVIHG